MQYAQRANARGSFAPVREHAYDRRTDLMLLRQDL
jgi:hypothetical protein